MQWNFIWNTNFFIIENASENNICEMMAILFWENWVNRQDTGMETGLTVLSTEYVHWMDLIPTAKLFSWKSILLAVLYVGLR